MRFNPPPNWPTPPAGWTPEPDWQPDPSWGPAPDGWQLWVNDDATGAPADAAPTGTGRKPWVARHKVLTGLGVFLLFGTVVGALNGGDDPGEAPGVQASSAAATPDGQTDAERKADEQAEADRQAAEQVQASAEASAQAEQDRLAQEQADADAAAAAAAEAARIGTAAQQNAYRQAVDYLDYTAFSHSGLVGQLEYEGYGTDDAEFAIARLEAEGGVDWNAQAVLKAQDYLDYTAFSHSGLVEQLEYEGFTPEQAEYGVTTAGL